MSTVAAPGATARLAALQDALGVLHDRHVLLDRVTREILLHGGARSGPRTAGPEPVPHPPTRRALTALRSALTRASHVEFHRVMRLARGGGIAAALATVDRLAVLLAGPDRLAEPPAPPLDDAPTPVAEALDPGQPSESRELPMASSLPGTEL